MPIQNQRTSAVIIRYVPHDKALARARRHIQGATLPQPSCVNGYHDAASLVKRYD